MLYNYFIDPKEKNTEEVKTEEQGVQVEEFASENIDLNLNLSWIDEWDNAHGDLILF